MKKLYKIKSEGKLFGVCAGLGEYFNIDPTLLRLIFVIGTIFSSSLLFWGYIICAILLPERGYTIVENEEVIL